MEKLTLTRRWVETKTETSTITLRDGLVVEYYGRGDAFIRNPCSGIIKNKNGVFVIEWEDAPDTILDGSKHCNEILSSCGFDPMEREVES